MAGLIARFRKGSLAGDAALLSAAMIGSQGIVIAATPLMSRIYSPSDFGLLATFSAISTVVGTALTLRYEMAVMLPKADRDSSAVMVLSLFTAAALGCTTVALSFVAARAASLVSALSALGSWLPLSIVNATSIAMAAAGFSWLTRQRAYGRVAGLRVLQSVLVVAIGISLGLLGTPKGLLIAQIAAPLATCAILLAQIFPKAPCHTRDDLVRAARENVFAPRYLLPTALLDVVSMQLPLLLVASWFGPELAGHYSLAWRTLALPMTLVGGAVGQVFYQRFAAHWPDRVAARSLLHKTWLMLAGIGLGPALLLMLFGERLFGFVFGEAWRTAGHFAALLSPMILATFVHSPTSTTFIVLGMQRWILWFGVAASIYRPLSLFYGHLQGDVMLGFRLLVVLEIIQIVVFQVLADRRISLHSKAEISK